MKKNIIFLIFIVIQILTSNIRAAGIEVRQHLLMDLNWKFIQSDVKGAEASGFNDTDWRILNLPHDWSIEGEFKQDAITKGPGGYLPTGIGWYRKYFTLSSVGKDQQFRIEFDGVYMNSDVWINGQHLGKHPYGYTSFYYDLTPFIKKGENLIAVRVDNSIQPNSRWYSGSGIYRHVWLDMTGPVHIAQWGTYITTPEVDSSSAIIKVRTSIENNQRVNKNIVLRSVVKDGSGKETGTIETPVTLKLSGTTDIEQIIRVTSPSQRFFIERDTCKTKWCLPTSRRRLSRLCRSGAGLGKAFADIERDGL
jgi:beta-galactosidase